MNKGSKGNISGNELERAVKNVLHNKGFLILPYSEWCRKPHVFGDELLLCNVPFQTVYGHKGKTEFLLKSAAYNLEIRIECKWQQVSGSVDEKLPYLYLNCIEAMPEKEIMILIDGKGWKPGSIRWLKAAVQHNKYQDQPQKRKKIHVFALTDFFTWANNTFTLGNNTHPLQPSLW